MKQSVRREGKENFMRVLVLVLGCSEHCGFNDVRPDPCLQQCADFVEPWYVIAYERVLAYGLVEF